MASSNSLDSSDALSPVGEETMDAFHDGLGESSREEQAGVGNGTRGKKKPWYKKPSPWWMLIMMPLSAMTLAGVNPSLFQIYSDLICKSMHRPVSNLSILQEPSISLSRTSFQILNHSSSSEEKLVYPLQLFSHPEEPIWLQYQEQITEDKKCSSDPKVQAEVARLMTVLTITLGILSCITAASWASLSDRIGRRPVLAIASSAIIISYSTFIAIYYFGNRLPGGYWILIVGPTIHGLLGGSAAAAAGTNAYIADCTTAADRARMFSLTLGLRFTAMAAGPTICSLLVRTTGTPAAALAFVVLVHIAYVLTMLFVVPESLSEEKRSENRRKWREVRDVSIVQNAEENTDDLRTKATKAIVTLSRSTFAFLRPLSVAGPISVTLPSGKTHRDWSLTFIVTSACLASVILASYPSMFQFGAKMFDWSAVELGYWYSGIVASRAITLTLILPTIIKIHGYYTNKNSTPNTEPTNTTPLLHSVKDRSQAAKTPAFDLLIAQSSLLLEVTCYAVIPILFSHGASHREVPYIIFTVLASCGAGFGPAIQALAADIYAGRGGTETGRLFGVLSVVQSISSQIIGPTLYGLTFMKIVAVYPQGIFFVSVAAVGCAVIFLLFVELPGKKREGTTTNDEDRV